MIPGKKYTPQDLVAIVIRRWWVIALPLVITSVATFFVAGALPDLYRSETLILVVPQRVPESYVKSTVTARIEERLESISQQILSRTRLERIIRDFGLYKNQLATSVMEDVILRMRAAIEIQVIKGDAFRVAYTGDDPRTVMQVTERLASLFIDENLKDRELLAEGSYQFLDGQLDEARRKLEEHEKTLEDFRRRYAGQLPTQLQSNLQMIQNTQAQVQTLTESIARDHDRRLMIERSIADTAPYQPPPPVQIAAGPGAGEIVLPTADQLDAARQSLAQLQLRLKEEHPDVIRLKRQIATLEAKVAEEAARPAAAPDAPAAPVARPTTLAETARQNRLNELRSEMDNLDRQIARKEQEEQKLRAQMAAIQVRVDQTPTRESDMTALTRDYTTLQTAYTSLLAKKEDSKVAANMERNQIGEQFKILDPARLPEKPSSPNRLQLYALGAAFGLFIGLALVGLGEFLDSTLKTDDDVQVALSLPVLAVVPKIIGTVEQRVARRRRWILAVASSTTALAAVLMLVWKLL